MTFGIGTGIGLSFVACANADAFGIGTGTGMSSVVCGEAAAFGIGIGTGMSPVTCADAVAIDRTPKANSVEIVFFIVVVSPSVVTRLLRAKEQQKSWARMY